MSRENAVVPAPPDVRGPERCTFLGLYRVQSLCVALERGARRGRSEWYEFPSGMSSMNEREPGHGTVGQSATVFCVIDLAAAAAAQLRASSG
jgi:hypothetical protein